MKLRQLLFGAFSGHVVSTGMPSLNNASLEEIRNGLNDGLYSSMDLVNSYQARILEVNDQVHAVIEYNPDAWNISVELQKDKDLNMHSWGPLHGIPILIKDNIATIDKMNSTAGSYALLGTRPREEATVVTKLRKAGAVILGKANLSQFADYRSTNSSNGWSAYGGQVTGPYYPNQDPSGSSSGSAVAVAMGLAAGTLGTETNGSIILPAAKLGVVGIKPTIGLTSRYNTIPVSPTRDTVGPIARTVRDAAIILQAIIGNDDKDTSAPKAEFLQSPTEDDMPDYLTACNSSATGLYGTTIGVPDHAIEAYALAGLVSGAEVQAFYQALMVLESGGAKVVRGARLLDFDQLFGYDQSDTVLVAAELAMSIPGSLSWYLKSLVKNPKGLYSLGSVLDILHKDPFEEYPERDTRFMDFAVSLNYDNSTTEYLAAKDRIKRMGGTGGMLGTLERNNLTALVMPTSISHRIAAYAGAPVVTVPMGYSPQDQEVKKSQWGLVEQAGGLPFGLAFMGNLWDERSIIGMAYAYEQRTLWRNKGTMVLQPKTEVMKGKSIYEILGVSPPGH